MALDFAPKTLVAGKAGDLTRGIIEQYGSDEDISGALIGHFNSGVQWGPRSAYLSQKRDEARSWLTVNPSTFVQDWIEKYLKYLSRQIENAQISEERIF